MDEDQEFGDMSMLLGKWFLMLVGNVITAFGLFTGYMLGQWLFGSPR